MNRYSDELNLCINQNKHFYILDSWVIAWKNVLKRWAVWGGMEGDKDFLMIDYLRDLSGDQLT